jgi:hypothetical protein
MSKELVFGDEAAAEYERAAISAAAAFKHLLQIVACRL